MKLPRRPLQALVLLVGVALAVEAASDVLAPLADTPPTGELAVLTVTAENPAGYDRALFGDWVPQAGGCDTRTAVLETESVVPAAVVDCTITGQWLSIYDGATTTDPSALDVDHLVPLAEAWASGAHGWTDERRRAYANDLDHPDALIAVTAATNRAKGDSDPAEWMPAQPGVHCRYATAWVTQKTAWGLTIDPAERDALAVALATCPQGEQP